MSIALPLVLGLVVGVAVTVALLLPALRERRENARRVLELERDLAAARTGLEAAEGRLGDGVRELVRAASLEAYGQTNTALVELAGAKLEGTVAPLRDSLAKVNQQVEALDRARAQSYGALREQLSALSERTMSLATALRSPHVRGRWGEIQLKRVVELAGMLPYCDFVEQETVASDEGRLRPDLLVRLPGGKKVVVDAKVPLAGYLEACEATDEEVRAERLADHARQVRAHLQKLSQKSYWSQLTDSPEYVVMFLPDEGFFRAAWEQDPELVELGVRSRVHIASPTTLIVLLQAIGHGWQQERVAEDARLVHQLGRELYERMTILGGHLTGIGSSLDRAVTAYNKSVASIETRVLPKARELNRHVLSDKELTKLEPITSHTRPLSAGELTGEDENPSLEILRGADAA